MKSILLSMIMALLLLINVGCQDTISSVSPTPTLRAATDTPPPTITPTGTPEFIDPTVTPTPTSSPTPLPTDTPTPLPRLRQLTHNGCCGQPFFSPDSQQVLFIDKPSADAPTGIYGVDVENPQTEAVLINETIGFRTPDRTIVALPEGDFFRLTNETTGESWRVDTKGNWPYFSPDGTQLIWNARDEEGPYDTRVADVWLAELDGSHPRLLFSSIGGGLIDWFADGTRLLTSSKVNSYDETRLLQVYDIEQDTLTTLFTDKRLREIKLSPGGSWIVFYVTFADDATRNGLWAIRADGSEQRMLDVPRFGAYRWRDDNTLIYIPMRAEGETSMQLLAIDMPTSNLSPLTEPETVSFSIANGDWDVSPDGQHVVFVNSADYNLWVIDLP